ncbi:MAG: HpsJ family protein [Cyanophyceae cyanobacterium]
MNTPSPVSSYTSLCLKLVGAILILSSLIDYLALAIPFNALDSDWQINFTTQIVDRGIVPLVGIIFLLIGYWIDSSVNTGGKSLDLRVPVFVLASFLGLLFLLLVPLHLNNLRVASSNVIEQIEQGAGEAETRIQSQFNQLNALSQDPQRLQQLNQQLAQIDQALSSGQFQGQPLQAEQRQQLQQTRTQLQNLRELSQNPEALEARLTELQVQLQDQKLERENRARTEALKQGLRIGLSSLMLAIGYIAVGWLGLRGLSRSKPARR